MRLGFMLLMALVSGLITAQAVELTAQRQEELRYLLQQDCGSCHGMTLKGGLGPALTTAALAGKSPQGLLNTVLDGRPGTAMPPWRGQLTTTEAAWLIDELLQGMAQ